MAYPLYTLTSLYSHLALTVKVNFFDDFYNFYTLVKPITLITLNKKSKKII